MDVVRGKYRTTAWHLLRVVAWVIRRQTFRFALWLVPMIVIFGIWSGEIRLGSADFVRSTGLVLAVWLPGSLIAWVLILLITHAFVHWKQRPGERETTIEIAAEGVTWEDADGNRNAMRWSAIRELVEAPTAFFVTVQPGLIMLVPKESFPVDSVPRIRALVSASGVRAELLS